MRQIFITQLEPMVATLVPGEAALRAGLLATQVLGFALCRYVLGLPPIEGMSRDQIGNG